MSCTPLPYSSPKRTTLRSPAADVPQQVSDVLRHRQPEVRGPPLGVHLLAPHVVGAGHELEPLADLVGDPDQAQAAVLAVQLLGDDHLLAGHEHVGEVADVLDLRVAVEGRDRRQGVPVGGPHRRLELGDAVELPHVPADLPGRIDGVVDRAVAGLAPQPGGPDPQPRLAAAVDLPGQRRRGTWRSPAARQARAASPCRAGSRPPDRRASGPGAFWTMTCQPLTVMNSRASALGCG